MGDLMWTGTGGGAVVRETVGATVLHSGRRRFEGRGMRWLDELHALVR